jgi:hypothetical protein
MANKVEKDLKAFIKDVRKVAVAFYLRPREEDKVIAKKKAINVVEVNLTELEGTFVFRGIREKYYNKLQKKYAKNIGFKRSGGAIEIL